MTARLEEKTPKAPHRNEIASLDVANRVLVLLIFFFEMAKTKTRPRDRNARGGGCNNKTAPQQHWRARAIIRRAYPTSEPPQLSSVWEAAKNPGLAPSLPLAATAQNAQCFRRMTAVVTPFWCNDSSGARFASAARWRCGGTRCRCGLADWRAGEQRNLRAKRDSFVTEPPALWREHSSSAAV